MTGSGRSTAASTPEESASLVGGGQLSQRPLLCPGLFLLHFSAPGVAVPEQALTRGQMVVVLPVPGRSTLLPGYGLRRAMMLGPPLSSGVLSWVLPSAGHGDPWSPWNSACTEPVAECSCPSG